MAQTGDGGTGGEASGGAKPPTAGGLESAANHEAQVLVEQYCEYVRQAARTTEQRLDANRYFVGFNTAIVAGYGFVFQYDGGQLPGAPEYVLLALAVAGIWSCVLWRRRILAYKNLVRIKFDIIHAVEEKFSWKPFQLEYKYYQRQSPFSWGELSTVRLVSLSHGLLLAWLAISAPLPCDRHPVLDAVCEARAEAWGRLSAAIGIVEPAGKAPEAGAAPAAPIAPRPTESGGAPLRPEAPPPRASPPAPPQ